MLQSYMQILRPQRNYLLSPALIYAHKKPTNTIFLFLILGHLNPNFLKTQQTSKYTVPMLLLFLIQEMDFLWKRVADGITILCMEIISLIPSILLLSKGGGKYL